jgi:acyl-coenzyme A synthetase/AMP-(fatty) acid ligase
MKKLGIGIMTTGSKKCPIVDTWWQTETGYHDFASGLLHQPNQPTPHYHCLNSTCFDERQV